MIGTKVYPVTYNKDHYTVLANDVLKGKQVMTLQEARIVRLLITQVVLEDKDLKTYTCRIQELAEFLGIDHHNIYRDVSKVCKDLLSRVIEVKAGNTVKDRWKAFHWISFAEYDGNGNLTLKLSEEIKPFVLELNQRFTQYQFKNVLAMQSYYAIRLYELLKMTDGIEKYKSEFEFSVDELREYFCCENKYSKIIDFKKNVINIATKEINDKTDLRIVPTYKKTGRAITHIIFEVHYKTKKQLDGQINFGGDVGVN